MVLLSYLNDKAEDYRPDRGSLDPLTWS